MRKRLPPLTALKSFEAAARLGSFKDAAAELFVSHSAISHQVKLLESYLEISLFERKARAVHLTKSGKAYYPIIREAFDRIAEGTELILKPKDHDILTVQLYSTFAIRWMIPRLPEFNAAYPNIKIRLNTSQVDVDFSHDDVDVCVMIGQRVSEDLHYDYLFTSEMFPVASPKLIAEKRLTEPSDLVDCPILQVHPSPHDWAIWLEDHGVKEIDSSEGLQFDSYDHALSTAMQGLGVALGMQPYVDKDLRSGMLQEIFPGQRSRAGGDWYAVCRQERMNDEKISLFRAWLLDALAQDSQLQPLMA
jgi:LysR family glycine cleavage system transcriptional activator